MAEEPTTPDLLERVRQSFEAANRGDLDAVTRFWDNEAVWDTAGFGTFEGVAAVRRFFKDWIASYEDFEIEAEEMLDLGNGVTFVIAFRGGVLLAAAEMSESVPRRSVYGPMAWWCASRTT